MRSGLSHLLIVNIFWPQYTDCGLISDLGKVGRAPCDATARSRGRSEARKSCWYQTQ